MQVLSTLTWSLVTLWARLAKRLLPGQSRSGREGSPPRQQLPCPLTNRALQNVALCTNILQPRQPVLSLEATPQILEINLALKP